MKWLVLCFDWLLRSDGSDFIIIIIIIIIIGIIFNQFQFILISKVIILCNLICLLIIGKS